MPRHNLYQMMLNCEDWRSSSFVAELPAAARGIFIDLLAAAWLTEDCTLPASGAVLRRLARPDSDKQWAEVWPLLKPRFVEQDGRIHNEVQMKAFTKANKIYEQRRATGKKGGVANALANKVAKEVASGYTTDNRQRSVVPTPDKPTRALHTSAKKSSTAPRKNGAPVDISNVLDKALEDVQEQQHRDSSQGLLHAVEALIGTEEYRSGTAYLKWASLHKPELLVESMDIIRNGQTEESRTSKGCVEIRKPVAFIRAHINKADSVGHVG